MLGRAPSAGRAWPAALGPLPTAGGDVSLRPLARRDFAEWRRMRLADQQLIERWDATGEMTWEQRHSRSAWRSTYRALRRAARRGTCLPFAIDLEGAFAGQVTLGGIVRGAVCSGWIGYWVGSEWSGRGVGTAAVALGLAHGLGAAGLHRVEATVDPANAASRAVVTHLGMREEGLLLRYLDIAGAWRDHLLYAMTAEELPTGPSPAAALVARHRRV